MKKDLIEVGNTGRPALRRPLTPAQFGDPAEVPLELEWLANLTNPKTRYHAAAHGLTVLTASLRHFEPLGVPAHNPPECRAGLEALRWRWTR